VIVRQQQPHGAPGHVDPEVAKPVGPGPGEAADHRDRHRQADRGRHELLHHEPGHLGEVAHGGFARVVLPVGVGGERDGGVPRGGRRDVGHPDGREQPVLRPLDQVHQQDADHREREDGAHVGGPSHVRVRVDPGQLVDAALDPPVVLVGEDARHVVAKRHVAGRECREEHQELQPAGGSAVHQNLSGKTRATKR
jgi:hypothetical protein